MAVATTRTVMLPAPSKPMEVARAVVARRYTHPSGELTLRHYRGGWWEWRTSHWAEVEHRAVRADLYALTEHACYERRVKKKVVLEPWNPNRHKIADLSEALAAATHLTETIAQPAWTVPIDVPPGAIVACGNGLLHVETRVLYAHDPRFFNVTAVPFDYDPHAAAPARWLGFLNDLWPDDDGSVDALQEFFGYVLSGRLDLQKMLLVVGPTRSGKGALTRVLGALVGRENVCGPTLSSLGNDFGLAPLLGKPLAVISDARLNGRGNNVVVERLLSVSGEDTITVNRKYRDQWTGKLPTRFVVLSNELPHFGDASAAIIGRFVAIQTSESWLGKEDLTLEPEMHEELAGVLSWALDGLSRLTMQGRFTVPTGSDEVLLTLADLASPVAAFVRDRCDRGPLFEVPVDVLYGAWKSWADDNGQKPGTTQTFGRNLRAAVPGVKVGWPREDRQDRRRWYRGIGLKDQR